MLSTDYYATYKLKCDQNELTEEFELLYRPLDNGFGLGLFGVQNCVLNHDPTLLKKKKEDST